MTWRKSHPLLTESQIRAAADTAEAAAIAALAAGNAYVRNDGVEDSTGNAFLLMARIL